MVKKKKIFIQIRLSKNSLNLLFKVIQRNSSFIDDINGSKTMKEVYCLGEVDLSIKNNNYVSISKENSSFQKKLF